MHGSNTVTVTGRVSSDRSGSRLVTVHRPELYAAAVFRAELKKAGVRVQGKTLATTTPRTLRRTLATDYSMRLSRLLVPYLKVSKAMRAYLASLGVPMSGVALSDGSGLSRVNTRVNTLGNTWAKTGTLTA